MIVRESDIRYKIKDAILNGHQSINDIYDFLLRKYSKEEIKYWIYILLTKDEKIVRNDNYYGNNSYELVPRRQEKSPYTKHYCSFTDDNPTMKKKILLISDTHIGNKSIQNIDLINAIYEYASKQGCEYVFHEGDLFEGYGNIQEQINTFIKEYPNTIKTICLLGNHDEIINSKIPMKMLNYYKDNFNTYELEQYGIELNNIPFHISHRLYISWLINDQRIDCIDDIYDVEKWISNDYNVLISGHLHQGIIHSVNQEPFDKLYLGVPSLSSININRGCAYIITIENDNIRISILSADRGLNINEIENIKWSLKENNKVLHKAFL